MNSFIGTKPVVAQTSDGKQLIWRYGVETSQLCNFHNCINALMYMQI